MAFTHTTPVLGPRSPVLSLWSLVLGPRSVVPGPRSSVFGGRDGYAVNVSVSPEIEEGNDVRARLAGPFATVPPVVYLEL
jgi:hypothetical protein